jgi:hypothetical protein
MHTRQQHTQLLALAGAGVILAGIYVVGLNAATGTLAALYAVAAGVALVRAREL